MDSPSHQENIVSIIKDMRSELDSKASDIAEIKDSLFLLKNFFLGTATSQQQANRPSGGGTEIKDCIPPRPPSAETESTQDDDKSSSIGTTLTKVSQPSAMRAISPSGGSEKNIHQSDGVTTSNKLSDVEDEIEKAMKKLPSYDDKHLLLRGFQIPASGCDEKSIRPRSTDGVLFPESYLQMKERDNAAENCESKAPAQRLTTKIVVNGVPRNIPSSIKGSASSKKPSMPIQFGGPAPPMMPIYANRASAPAQFPGWQGAFQHPYAAAGSSTLQVPAIGKWQSGKFSKAIGPAGVSPSFAAPLERQNHRPAGGGKPRPRQCTLCGDTTHFHKQCPKKFAISKPGRFDKKFGSDGNSNNSFGPRGSKDEKPAIDRLDKAPSYPIDRQLELIEKFAEQIRLADLQKAAQLAVRAGSPCN